MSLIRLGEYQRGEITFQGTRIDGLSRKELRPFRTRMQVVFQDPFSSLNPRMIVRQILEEGLIVNNSVPATCQAMWDNVLVVGLGHYHGLSPIDNCLSVSHC